MNAKKIEADSDLPLHIDMESAPANFRLRSRNPFWRFYQERHDYNDLQTRWIEWWQHATVANKQLVADPTVEVKGLELPRRLWLRINRFRTGQGCCADLMQRWKFIESPLCECGVYTCGISVDKWAECIRVSNRQLVKYVNLLIFIETV